MFLEENIDIDTLRNTIEEFDVFSEKNRLENKDIYSYKSFSDLQNEIDELINRFNQMVGLL